MNRIILCVALFMLSANGRSYAQQETTKTEKKSVVTTKTEKTFNMYEYFINIRDYVYLENETKLIIEMNNTGQYASLAKLDSILKKFVQEIAFYKDSLENGTGSVRIDYTLDFAHEFSTIRFKKHQPDGDIFVNRQGDVSKLKLEQDTVRIFMRQKLSNYKPSFRSKDMDELFNHTDFMQLTFCLNNYTDIQKLIGEQGKLQHIFDTLKSTKYKSTVLNPSQFPSSSKFNLNTPDTVSSKIRFRPYDDRRFRRYNGLAKSDDVTGLNTLRRNDALALNVNAGCGLVRNSFAPYGEIGLSVQHHRRRPYSGEYPAMVYNVFMSSYFFFEQDANRNFLTKTNWFVNASIGESDELSGGVGYLVKGQGDYFKGLTTKVFLNIRLLKKGLTLSPELIFTDNFRQVFPGITLKAL